MSSRTVTVGGRIQTNFLLRWNVFLRTSILCIHSMTSIWFPLLYTVFFLFSDPLMSKPQISKLQITWATCSYAWFFFPHPTFVVLIKIIAFFWFNWKKAFLKNFNMEFGLKYSKYKYSNTRTKYSNFRVLVNLVKTSSTRVLDTRHWNH
jgi:hypothetical protein